ncbi:MAG TPA: peptidylprolyl isomerase [Pseudonocardiaceae bacterium]|nr:peptidylprolyl isomerase [Pseudonocardiaceae bacterium]
MTASHRRVASAAAVTALLGLLAGCSNATGGSAVASRGSATLPPSAGLSAPAVPAGGSAKCDFTATPDQPAPAGHAEGLPPSTADRSGTVTITLHTTAGDVPISMPRAQAPCTVASFTFLAGKGYFDKTPCHRITDYPEPNALFVLQCGDPTGSGSGGPGYTIPDENPTDLKPAPGGQNADVYPRGTVAMANTGQPHSGGSQFFLVYRDSNLPPSYATFGTVAQSGLSVLDKIAAGGITPGTDPSSGQTTPNDGKPKNPVVINSATVGS